MERRATAERMAVVRGAAVCVFDGGFWFGFLCVFDVLGKRAGMNSYGLYEKGQIRRTYPGRPIGAFSERPLFSPPFPTQEN